MHNQLMKWRQAARWLLREWWVRKRTSQILEEHNCRTTEVTYDAVGAQGDARAYGPGIIIDAPGKKPEQAGEIGTTLINNTRLGLTRVLMDVPPDHLKKS